MNNSKSSSYVFLKEFYFSFKFVYMCLTMCECSTHGGQQVVLDLLEPELQTVWAMGGIEKHKIL